MRTATEAKQAAGFPAPVSSPNEFHLDEHGQLANGLGTTQYPANIKSVSPEEAVAIALREQNVADAENQIEAKKQQALGEIAQEEAKLAAERAEFEAEKAAFAEAQKKAAAAAPKK